MLMPGDLTAVEILNTQVKDDGKNQGEIQQNIRNCHIVGILRHSERKHQYQRHKMV